jgi:hypothetical protein
MASERDAADAVLDLMAQLGIIWQEEHPLGGRVWIFNSRLFGRTDNITYNPRGRKTKIRYKDREGSEYHYRGGRFVRRRSAGRLKNAASRTRRNRTQAQI